MTGQNRRSRYFQEISQAFLNLRGAPYVLSARDIAVIAAWEEARIPLRVVLEGIRMAEEVNRRGKVGKKRLFSLFFCRTEVERAFAAYKDRRVGRKQKAVSRREKVNQARTAAARFLSRIPPEIEFLREPFEKAQTLLARRNPPEREIEELEKKIEELIVGRASLEERDSAWRKIEAEFAGQSKKVKEEILPVQLVKQARAKYRIPHLSLFYY